MHISACVNLVSVPTGSNLSAVLQDGFHLCELQFTEALVLQARVKLILRTCRISIGLVSLYFLITKIPLSELVKLVCLAINVLTGWELWICVLFME